MGEDMQTYKKVNIDKLKSRITKTISTNEALKDVEPMVWAEEVMSGNEKVIISKRK